MEPGSGARSGIRTGPGSGIGAAPGSSSSIDAFEVPGSGTLPATEVPSASRVRPRRTENAAGLKTKWPWIAAAAVGLLIAIGLGIWLSGGDDDPEPNVVPDSPEVTEDDRPLTVGPEGRFPSLTAAISYLKEQDDPLGPEEARVVLLPKGVITERLIADGSGFDFPEYVTFQGHADGTVFRTPGAAPSIAITGLVRGLTLENLTVDAEEKAVAVEVAVGLNESRIKGLTIEGLTGTGILLRGLSNDGFDLEGVTITSPEGGDPEAIGIQIVEGGVNTLTVTGGSITGAAVGVDVDANVTDVTLSGLRIASGTDGVRFGDAETGRVALKNVTLKDLVFAGLTRGVAFGNAPRQNSEGLVIADCEFGDTEEPIAPSTHTAEIKAALNADASTGNRAENASADPLGLFP
ncbi:hypothetical protein LzC2_16760 [Planctomycetes bacterium LzC2]|uniref:Right-handed parallel beta-helix repeat-containing protein n=1 Tax=Alienimonas chondri TaxID=2681879 RepID=A0ABX1VC19_9PLAN|nr:hypothetical protein [Alienimonas chondri]